MTRSIAYRSDQDAALYDPATIWLHWTTVGLIAIFWVIAQSDDWLPRGPLRTGIWSIHVTLGFAAGLVLLSRVAWRALFGRVLPPSALHADRAKQ